jgi:hypothetical protein
MVLRNGSSFFIMRVPKASTNVTVDVGWGKRALHFFHTLSQHPAKGFLLSHEPSFFAIEKQVWIFDKANISSMVDLKDVHHDDTSLHDLH